MMKRNVCVLVLAGLICCPLCLADDNNPAGVSAAPSIGAVVALTRIRALMGRPRASSQAEYARKIEENRSQVLDVLAEMEKKHPKAKELPEARLHGVRAAAELARLRNDPKMGLKVQAIAGRIIASDAPGPFKLHADAHLLLLKLRPVGLTTMPATASATAPAAADVEKYLRRFAQRYAGTDEAVGAIEIAMQLSRVAESRKAFDQLVQMLAKDHADNRRARNILRQLGKGLDIGKPFTAALTKLDGTKLTLPGDLLGKVVVIDFWAIWCRPCITALPHMKSLYAKYRPRGVEFVGISLDKNIQNLRAFVAGNQMGWIHTCSGQGWADPTTRKYGIGGIPSVWVVGKDGKVVSDNALGDLPAMIEKALSGSTTRPSATTRPAGQ